MKPFIIGVTGPTGCGKTTLLETIRRRGGTVIDCDALYYELLASEEGTALRQELQTAFPTAFDESGSLLRKKLGTLVFGSAARMAQLNEIVFFHIGNAVRARLGRAQADGAALFAIDAINLFESGLAGLCEETVGARWADGAICCVARGRAEAGCILPDALRNNFTKCRDARGICARGRPISEHNSERSISHDKARTRGTALPAEKRL